MIFKDYYKILGLKSSRVSLDDIKIAYRENAKKYHPDVNVGDSLSEEKFKDINDFSKLDDYIKNYCANGCKWFYLKKMK